MSTASLDSLSWIKTELERALESARRRLDAYAEEPEKQVLLDEFIESTHQAAGTFAMIAVRGGEMLAGHMEELARAIRDGSRPADSRNFEVLMRASLELSGYLERMAAGMRDTPAALLPIVNELRAGLGKAPLARERLGRPAPLPVPARAGGEDPVALAARLRPRYQAALLAFYQGREDKPALARMREVVAQLEAAATSPPVFEFLWVTGGLLEALDDGGIAPTLAVKRALGQVDRELKRLAIGSEAAVAEAPPEALVESMLAELEHAHSNGERVLAIRGNFGLEDAEETPATAGGVGSALLASAAGAILEDLGRVRDHIDLFVRTRSGNPSDLEPLVGMLKKVRDALDMLGLEEARTHIERQRETVLELVAGDEVTQDALLGLATGLIGVESDVEAFLAGSAEAPQAVAERGARVAGMREALADISRIKEAIAEYLHNPAAATQRWELPLFADSLARTLAFLTFDEVAAPMRRIARYLERLTASPELPERMELDRLADAVVSIEYYLETLQRGRVASDSMLANADRALQALGIEDAPAVEGSQTFAPPEPPLAEAPPLAPPAPMAPTKLPPVRMAGADPEIVAVFLDEAVEVGEALAQAYPEWRENPDDRDALAVLRRSFHTLKGSGRMVGAQRLGELAWAYENLLNRVLDYTLPPAEPIIAAVGEAIGALSELREQFDTGAEPSADVRALLERAERLVRDESLTAAEETETDRAAGEKFAFAAESGLIESDTAESGAIEEEPIAYPAAETTPEETSEAELAADAGIEEASIEEAPIPRLDTRALRHLSARNRRTSCQPARLARGRGRRRDGRRCRTAARRTHPVGQCAHGRCRRNGCAVFSARCVAAPDRRGQGGRRLPGPDARGRGGNGRATAGRVRRCVPATARLGAGGGACADFAERARRSGGRGTCRRVGAGAGAGRSAGGRGRRRTSGRRGESQ